MQNPQNRKPTYEELVALNAALAEKLAEASKPKSLTLKVSEKGALSVYGLQRMPVTLYIGQWERLLAFSDQIAAFAKANNHLLARKS